jgi:aspartyl protease family protein
MRSRLTRLIGPTLLALLLSGNLWADPEIIASGLFKGKAMLTIDGVGHFLKVGETSPEGIKLISSDSKQATIEVAGKRVKLNLSQRIAAKFTQAKAAEVKLLRHQNGHFFAGGAINGRPARFMVDTGATAIAININEARRLGIDPESGTVSTASTAGGIVKTYIINLNKVRVGSITLHNVVATIVDGDHPIQILLGNTFLSRVNMSEQGGVMVLRKKY